MTGDQSLEIRAVKMALEVLIAHAFTQDQIAQLSVGMSEWLENQELGGNVRPLRAAPSEFVEVTQRAVQLFSNARDLRQRSDLRPTLKT